MPPRVEYSLTEPGRSINAALKPLGEWDSKRIERIAAKRVVSESEE